VVAASSIQTDDHVEPPFIETSTLETSNPAGPASTCLKNQNERFEVVETPLIVEDVIVPELATPVS
jgi:hypothetical protein